MSKIFLAQSKNGKTVWYDSETSHAATHIQDTPNLDKLAAEVVRQTDINGDMQFHTDLGRVVGTSDLVQNDPGDEIIYAKRLNRNEYTSFNKSKSAQPSSVVTVALDEKDDGSYELVSTWIGPSDSPSFPGTERETPESKTFWTEHSLAWGNQDVQPGSITTECPW